MIDEIEVKNDIQEEELYTILKNCVNSNGLPVMDNNLFSKVTEMYGREKFRIVLAKFITNELSLIHI